MHDASVDGESIFPNSNIMFAEFNPGTPVITVPAAHFQKLIKHFTNGLKEGTYFCDGTRTCFRSGKCSQGPQPTLKIKLGSGTASDSPALYFEVHPENILIDTTEALGSKGTYCLLGVMGTVGED